MAYQIDFTERRYVLRERRKRILRFLLLAVIGGIAYGAYDVFTVYQEFSLDEKLAKYEAAARPIEEICREWDGVEKEYNAMLRYYGLVWSANPTNFLCAMASASAPNFGRGVRPVRWKLTTGGACQLDYRFTFDPGDKALQAKGLSDRIANAVTAAVEVVGNVVTVKGVTTENLRDVPGFDIVAQFSVTNAWSFKKKHASLDARLKEIGDMRNKVCAETKLEVAGKAKAATTTAQGIMAEYLPATFSKDKDTGEPRPDFPEWKSVINVGGWFAAADRFIAKYHLPSDPQRDNLRKAWRRIGEARLPWGPWDIWEPLGFRGFWGRFRTLDNASLVRQADRLAAISEAVQPFRAFLHRCRTDCRKKLEPFVNAYDHDEIFNRHIVDVDLVRVARKAGITRALASSPQPKDEIKDAPSVLEKDDERFTFTWVRWNFQIGDGDKQNGMQAQEGGGAASDEPITVAKLADCVCKVLRDGPGYVVESVEVNFGEDGNVSGAVLRGLVPVKKSVTIKKEGAANVR